MRGPQRPAVSSSGNTLPACTADMVSQPGRAATVSADTPHSASARKIRSGSTSITYSGDNCGYPQPSSSAGSAMFSSPNRA